MMEPSATKTDPDLDAAWSARLPYWRRKLRRLRLEAEPLETQLARYRRVTWALTAIPLAIALMFVALFSAFRRPDVGIVLALILLAPVVAVAWIDDQLLRRRAAQYARELAEHHRRTAR
jgi:integral membrane sensor domain MASE1